ncbi:MAG: XdhC family protein [Caulobacter sp.]|jgi:xanthine dehydrogenase accessory factor|uniref:Xanthine and CO dehydrogenases maturation factor, XdhC/CoxF family n=1 Tax=Caulobacter vibrioides OR37 TaxID=1292034 RepID=R0D240_CAUVI|nr:xanthine and CO dehydrogenases maturation factor, XdhC/CoxF family [Caulobacter vibrioides OR37]MBQ1562674.1 XdhC family protein [Caulobacter sp.]
MTSNRSDGAWPMHGMADDARPALAEALSRGPAALATIVALGDGGPRPVGTQMVFGDGIVSGFLSGGCIEADVERHARACLADGQPRRLVYGEGSPWPDIRLLCGARIEILAERIAPDDPAVRVLLDLATCRAPAFWVTDGARRLCAETPQVVWPGAFERAYDPAPRLIVLGGDPTALAVASLGAQSGFETVLVRPKGPVDPPPLPGVAYRREDAATALAAIGLDAWTAVAVCGHDLELDHVALMTALPSPAPYVGLLGARRRLPERLARLKAAGLTDRHLAKLRAPIGLDLGGKAPFEVAVSVIGEIMAARHTEKP